MTVSTHYLKHLLYVVALQCRNIPDRGLRSLLRHYPSNMRAIPLWLGCCGWGSSCSYGPCGVAESIEAKAGKHPGEAFEELVEELGTDEALYRLHMMAYEELYRRTDPASVDPSTSMIREAS